MKQGSTPAAILAEAHRIQQAAVDYIAPIGNLQLQEDCQTLKVLGVAAAFTLTPTAKRQLAKKLSIPWGFYAQLKKDPYLLMLTVNRAAQHVKRHFMIRTLDCAVRAVLSPGYQGIDHAPVLDRVFALLSHLGDLDVGSCNLTSDELFVKFLSPRLTADIVVGDAVQAGVMVTNSETDLHDLRVQPFLHRLVCKNGMVVTEYIGSPYSHRRVHVKVHAPSQLSTFRKKLDGDLATREALDAAMQSALADDRFKDLVERLRGAMDLPITVEPEVAVQNIGRAYRLRDIERVRVLWQLDRSPDLTAWALINAITDMSKYVATYEAATRYERLSWTIATLPRRSFNALVNRNHGAAPVHTIVPSP